MKRPNLFIFIALVAIAFIIYSNSLDNQFLYDDDDFFVRNKYTKDWKYLPNIFSENVISGSGLVSNYYRPLLSVSFLINYKLGGLNPLGYHIFNIAFHAIASFLVYLLICRIIKNRQISMISSVIYLVHPVQTEAVAYITGRADPLSALFALLSLFMFLHSFDSQGIRKYIYLSSSLISFIMALLSREAFIVLPLLMALYLICFRRKKIDIASLWETFIAVAPFLVVLGIYIGIRLTILNFANTLNFYSESNIFTENMWYRILTFLSVLLEYFKLIVFPLSLNFERQHPIFTTFFNPIIIFSSLLLLIISYFMYMSWKSSKVAFFGFSWFFITLFPVSNIIVPVNGIIYEHWLYVPMAGLALILGHSINRYYHKLENYFKGIAVFIIIIVIVLFSVRTYVRNDDWQDAFTFYKKTIKDSPDSVRLNNNLAMEHDSRGDYQSAMVYYKRAMELSNEFAQPYYNLGNLYVKMGRYQDAIISYEQAIRIDPDFPFTYPRLAELYNLMGRKEDARRLAAIHGSRIG